MQQFWHEIHENSDFFYPQKWQPTTQMEWWDRKTYNRNDEIKKFPPCAFFREYENENYMTKRLKNEEDENK